MPIYKDVIMLVLSRKKSETIFIGDAIKITFVDPPAGRVRIGIDAPANVPIVRGELERKQDDERA